MTAKELFRQDKDLTVWWISVANDSRFEKVLVYARADLLEEVPDTQILQGVKALQETLLNLAQPLMEPTVMPASGLHHFPDTVKPKEVED